MAEDPTSETLDATTTDASPRSAHRELERGTLIDRYVVLARIGAGAMGMVYAAYDPELDRKVALKLLRAQIGGGGVGTRLTREARALAKLNHPNVVTVHDVGTMDDRVWLAMELVAGRTLGTWLAERRRSWREVVEIVRPVALGLAAAHEAGLVHGDIKPDNIMLGDEPHAPHELARVRVMDFGLARLAVERDHERAMAGTPGYMSPEQWRAQPGDARSDQFSLCVVMWEALFGERPFAGSSVTELATAVLEGDIRSPPRARVPAWLRRIARRGLERDPERRYESMAALLAALDRGRRRARVPAVVATVAGLALVGAAVLGAREIDRRRTVAACEAEGEAIALVWNDGARARLLAELAAGGASHDQVTAQKVLPWLEQHAESWRHEATEACLDANVRHVWNADELERARWCLSERRLELQAAVEQLGSAGPVDNAVKLSAGLTAIQPCRDAALLARLPAPPSEHRDEIEEVRRDLSRARAMAAAGAIAEGVDTARDAVDRASAIDWAPLSAAARLRLGATLVHSGAFADAESELENAYFRAVSAGATEVAADAAEELVLLVGDRLARPPEGLRWSRHAEVLLETLPDPFGVRQARHLRMLAVVHFKSGDYVEAKRLHEQALAMLESALGPDHPDVAAALTNLGNVHYMSGNYAEARQLYERALAAMEQAYGSEHPGVAQALNNLASVDFTTGSYDRAKATYERALAIREATLPPDHPLIAQSLNNLASVHATTGDYVAARRLYERALAVLERALGPEHPEVAITLDNLGHIESLGGADERALALHERALAISSKALGPDHPDVATSLVTVCEAHRQLGHFAEAKPLCERAVAIRERALGPTHPEVALPLVGLALIALAEHRPRDAVTLAERALSIRERADVPVAALAQARFQLARALVDAQLDRARAMALAEQARTGYRDAGPGSADELAGVEGWLATHSR